MVQSNTNAHSARRRLTATLLNDGTVLVTGGVSPDGTGLSSAELFHPSTNTWSSAGSIATARADVDKITATLTTTGVAVSHPYAPGTYLVQVSAADDAGFTSLTATAVVVISASSTDTITVNATANPGDVQTSVKNGPAQSF